MSYDARHQQLLDVAEHLFAERTFALVTMEDIARAAKVTRPIVYNHFDSKDGAYVACLRRMYELHNDGLRSLVDTGAEPVDQLRAGAEVYFSSISANEGRWLMMFTSASVLSGPYREELTALRFGHIQTIASLLRASVPDAPDDEIEATAHALSGIGERLGHWWLTRPDLDQATIVEYYVSIALGGVGRWLQDVPDPE